MLTKTRTWKLHSTALTAVAMLFLGIATLVCAQEGGRDVADIQKQIDRLQAELQQAKQAELQQVREEAVSKPVSAPDRMKPLPGNYFGMEGNDWIGIVIGDPKDNVYPITIYEDGLPGHGYDQRDDDKYIGTAVIDSLLDENKVSLNITLNQKFDEQREEPVERVLRTLKAVAVVNAERNELVITIPRNREWGAVRVVKQYPKPAQLNEDSTPPTRGSVALAGRYLGYEGDDRMGMVLTPTNEGQGTFDIVFYEDGLPGAGYNRRDDDRYEGTATFRGNRLEITLTKKFDEERPDRLEHALQNMTGTVSVDNAKNVKIDIPRNAEWDGVSLKKL